MKRIPILSMIIIFCMALAACGPAITPPEEPAVDDSATSEEVAEESAEEAEESAEEAEEPAEEAAEEMAEAEVADIVDTAIAAGNFTTLVAAVDAAGLVETLKGEGPFTVFAPTDDAFAALPEGTVESLLEDPEGALTDILLYHVVSGSVMAADVVGMDGAEVETVGGGMFTVVLEGDAVMLQDGSGNSVAVVATDIEASNGVIHVIDAVLMPAAADEEGEEAEVEGEEADEEMAEEEAEVESEEADEEMANEEEGEEAADAEMVDIVDTAVAAGSFTTLVAAVDAAGLVETLKGEGPFTVFAPTDDAFAALPEGTVEGLLEDPEGALTNILLYHVVSGSVMAADVVGMDGAEVETVGGGMFTVMLEGDAVMLQDGAGNSVAVVSTDIETSNGVIHVIDAVLMPE